MSYHEKKSLWEVCGGILIFGGFALYAIDRTKGLEGAALNDLQMWGGLFLILVATSVIARIALHIVFSVIHAAATREAEPGFEDERDKLIELKAIRNAYYASGICVAAAMASLVLGIEAYMLFVLLGVAGLASEVVEGMSKYFLYRRGC
jgi:small-conductance mechanosensitive channel